MKKMINSLKPILHELYMYSGDRDECCMKHFENGLCILYIGGNPCDQSLYADYKDSGISEEEWLKVEKGISYSPRATFREDLWRKLYSTYNSLDEEGKDYFWIKAHPFGHISDCPWLQCYR